MSFGTKATLNTGAQIPTLGYGTWQSDPGVVGQGVYEALKAGYRHLDLAKVSVPPDNRYILDDKTDRQRTATATRLRLVSVWPRPSRRSPA